MSFWEPLNKHNRVGEEAMKAMKAAQSSKSSSRMLGIMKPFTSGSLHVHQTFVPYGFLYAWKHELNVYHGLWRLVVRLRYGQGQLRRLWPDIRITLFISKKMGNKIYNE